MMYDGAASDFKSNPYFFNAHEMRALKAPARPNKRPATAKQLESPSDRDDGRYKLLRSSGAAYRRCTGLLLIGVLLIGVILLELRGQLSALLELGKPPACRAFLTYSAPHWPFCLRCNGVVGVQLRIVVPNVRLREHVSTFLMHWPTRNHYPHPHIVTQTTFHARRLVNNSGLTDPVA